MILFKKLTDILSEVYKKKGFKKNGHVFRLNQANNIAIIYLQKSKDNIPNGTKFTINIGIYFKSLDYFNSGEDVKNPIINDCQWKVRIGNLMQNKSDYWWTIQENSDLNLLSSELIDIFNSIILPAIQDRISDELYIEKLIKDNIVGNSIIEKLVILSSFFCIYNDIRLNDILNELQLYCSKNRLDYLYQSKIAQIRIWKCKTEGQSKWGFYEDSYRWI